MNPAELYRTANRFERESAMARREGRKLGAKLLHDKAVQFRGVASILIREGAK